MGSRQIEPAGEPPDQGLNHSVDGQIQTSQSFCPVAPEIELMARLAKALETSISDLLPEAETPDPLPLLREQVTKLAETMRAADREHVVDAGPDARPPARIAHTEAVIAE